MTELSVNHYSEGHTRNAVVHTRSCEDFIYCGVGALEQVDPPTGAGVGATLPYLPSQHWFSLPKHDQSAEHRRLASVQLHCHGASPIGQKLAAAQSAAWTAAAGTSAEGAKDPAPAADPKLGRRLGKLAKRAEDIAAGLEHP